MRTEKGGVWQALPYKIRITEGCFEGKEGIIKGDYQPQRKSPFFEKGGDSLFRVFCIPEFKNEDEEHEFWAIHSPLDYFDSSSIRRAAFPNLKPSLKSISIRVPSDMLAELKNLANKKDVPYQSLAKVYLARQIALERGSLIRSPRKKGKEIGKTLRRSPRNIHTAELKEL